jgi:hypothetical protein
MRFKRFPLLAGKRMLMTVDCTEPMTILQEVTFVSIVTLLGEPMEFHQSFGVAMSRKQSAMFRIRRGFPRERIVSS